MKLYLSIIGVTILILTAVNTLLGIAVWYYALIAAIFCVALQFALDGTIAIIINKMPDRWFHVDNALFSISEAEKRFYQKVRVRQWKDKVWELGGLGGFSKKNLKAPNDPAHIEKFIVECHKGVLTHRLAYPIGFLAMLTLPGVCSLTIALPIAVVNLFLNILPTLVLRYNTPLLKSVLKRLQRKVEKTSYETTI